MTQALYRKWRPQKWDEVVAQEHIVQTLRNAVATDRVAHAYLFAGPRGTGKTTAARLLAKAVNCLDGDLAERPCNQCAHCVAVTENRFMDLIEIDAASNTSVDDVRDLRDKINFSPNQGKFKIYIIDEVHMLSTAAFNALLKTLEEPPPHAIFVLATTEIHKIPATVLSRCQRHEFRRVPVDLIAGHLSAICKQEKIKAAPEALTLIARQSSGGMRDAISLLDQLSSTGNKITIELAQTVLGTATSETVLSLLDAILDREPASGMDAIHRALDGGADPRSLARQIVDYLRGLMLIQLGNRDQVEATKDVLAQMQKHAGALSTGEVLRLMRAFNAVAADTRGGWQPSLGLELALAESLELPQDQPSAAAEAKPAAARPKVRKEPVAETPVEAEKSEKSSTPAPVTLEQVAKSWKQIMDWVRPHNVALNGLLNSCKVLEIKDGALVLGFVSEVLLSKMEQEDQVGLTRQAVKEVLGVDLQIRCVVSNARTKNHPDVKPDGMVAAALQNGGEIVDIQ
ncbi:MAG: DNA polymerase III subunit gamma/tau [Chloroflexota bacterium]